MELGLHGKVAIVTGASQGIGRSVAEGLAAEGASVVLAARNPASLEKAVADIVRQGGGAVGVPADVEDPGSAPALRDAALQHFGRIDIVVNNAGGYGRGGDRIEEFDEGTWMMLYRLNMVSAARLSMACLPALLERGWGRVVNVASTFARDADPRFAPYGAAKAALLHFTKAFALKYSDQGVLSNAVLPGLTRSEGVLAGYAAVAGATGRTVQDIEQRMMDRQPIATRRTGDPAEVAAAITFLCSEPASWITGSCLLVDGGTIRAIP